MALLLPPRRPTRLVRASGNAPAKGLAAFFGFQSNDSWWDSVTGLKGITDPGQSRCTVQDGVGLQYNGAARVVYTNFSNPGAVVNDQLTVIARLKLTTLPGSSCAAAYYGNNSASRGAHIGFTSSGFASGGAETSNGMTATVDSVNHIGEWVTIGGSNDGNITFSGAACMWLNGIFQGTNFNGGTTSPGTPTQINLGRDPANYQSFFTGQIAWVAAFNRVLSNGEHLAVHRDPYGWCLGATPDRRRVYAIASGNVYNVSMAEAGSAAELLASLAILPSAINDNAAAADAPASLAVLRPSQAETATPADAPASTALLPSALADAASAANVQGSTGVLPSPLADVLAPADAPSSTAVLPSQQAEAASAQDTDNALPGNLSAIVEAASALETVSAALVAASALTDSAPATDTRNSAAVLPAALAEFASLVDQFAAQMAFMNALVENGLATDLMGAQAILYSGIMEQALALDAVAASAPSVTASKCNILGSAPRIRVLGSEQRVRLLGGDCC